MCVCLCVCVCVCVCVYVCVCVFCKEFLINKNRKCQGLSVCLVLGWRENGCGLVKGLAGHEGTLACPLSWKPLEGFEGWDKIRGTLMGSLWWRVENRLQGVKGGSRETLPRWH